MRRTPPDWRRHCQRVDAYGGECPCVEIAVYEERSAALVEFDNDDFARVGETFLVFGDEGCACAEGEGGGWGGGGGCGDGGEDGV